ncbi:uncharacterized protein [Onthophagus taurus]|uniref:uncharacterized protein n=1 Tax=Onthophagus taurus TaxID=166361 RepID=UPI000C209EB4|nr:uncharacterized protein LOC111425537 [Onthophagus taurus]
MTPGVDINVTYIWNKSEIYVDAIKKIHVSDVIYVVPINYTNKMDPTKTVPSLLYVCSKDSVFIFDLIMLQENGLTQELLAILYSDMVKYVYSKRTTFNRLGYSSWHHFVNVFDIEGTGPQFSPFCTGDNAMVEIRIEDVDWSVRPFQANEQILAGYRIQRLMTSAMKNRLLVCLC